MLLDDIIQKCKPLIRFITAGRGTGIWMEKIFWRRWLKVIPSEQPDLFRKLVDPDEPLSEYHRRFIDFLPDSRVRILDVGAGPLTILGKRHPTKQLEIVATDILAKDYAAALARRKIHPLVKTIYADAEKLTSFFPASSFDYVFACNSLDHCADPAAAIKEMIAVVKPGCFVTLRHGRNEAEKARYAGLHQWNFDVSGASLILWNRSLRLDMTRLLSSMAEVQCRIEGSFVNAHLRKRALQ